MRARLYGTRKLRAAVVAALVTSLLAGPAAGADGIEDAGAPSVPGAHELAELEEALGLVPDPLRAEATPAEVLAELTGMETPARDGLDVDEARERLTRKRATERKKRLAEQKRRKKHRSAAETVIQAALDQIGKPYRWAGSGPSSFDCSGLTMYAWAKAGVYLPHNSRAQYAALPRVSRDELRPGDLVFSGYGRITHVGLYIGDGKMVHSPQTGRTVEIAPLRSNYIGAARPKP